MANGQIDVAVIGAGPYGLSLGAHLQSYGIDYRVFGDPMHTWRTAMPKGMYLKSDGFASNLSDVKGEFTLGKYCAEKCLPYADMGRTPVPIETFIEYSLAFRQRFVNNLEEQRVKTLQQSHDGFLLELSDGSKLCAHRVVLAVGITYFSFVPEELRALPPQLCTHSSHHVDLDQFRDRHVAIVGGGSSALDLAALLHQAGANVDLIARRATVRFHEVMRVPRPLRDRIYAPTSGLGPGWRPRFYTDAAPLFHRLSESYRLRVVRDTFGPVAGWFMHDHVIGKVAIMESTTVEHAEQEGDHVKLQLCAANGVVTEMICDHVIAATGYKPDLRRVEILAPELVVKIDAVENTPILSAHFESSVPGLYFVGPIAANSFGPMMRFAYGSRFVARRLTRYLAKHSGR
jgi:thioredoxin reductase